MNRALVTMDRHFLSSWYVQLLIRICHRRNIHALGGMAAQIPIKNDPAANDTALDKVRQDKLREVKAGQPAMALGWRTRVCCPSRRLCSTNT